jgi:2OG-Fe(II) oxygenase superfamily
MNITYNNFIGIYDNLYPDGYCQHLIKEFDRLSAAGAGANRWQTEKAPETRKNDYQLGLGLKGHDVQPFDGKSPVDIFFDGLQACYEQYCQKFSTLMDGKIRGTVMKLQRTDPGGGYHVWHGEQGNGEHANRVLVYMLYLNSLELEEAGETEFLYQQQRFRPTENQMILWPAAFTHTHRGNTVFGKRSKYIATGWFYYD